MTPQQVVGMAVRLFAIWLVVIAFQLYGLARATVYMAPYKTSASMIYGGVVLALILAVVLWLFPMLVAHKIVPRTHHTNTLRMPAREATAAASAILGLWVLIGALPQVMGISGISIVGGGSHAVIAYFSQEPGRLAQFTASGFQCVLGLLLLLKPWWVASKVFTQPATEQEGT